MDNFMEGVNYEDYCEKCGSLLHEIMTKSDGSKKMVAHEIDGINCIHTQLANKELFREPLLDA